MKILSCIFVIIGAIVGAGFASGKEIYTFFFIYGKCGILGIILSTCIIGYAIYKTLTIINKYNIKHYDELLDTIIGKISLKNIDLKIILNFIINVFLLITFFVMCAGFAAYFKQELGINEIISGLLISIFCYLLLNKNIKGVLILNSILIPSIIIILVVLGFKCFYIEEIKEIGVGSLGYTSAILYSSYNSITLISILMPMKGYIKTKKDIFKIAIICTLIMIILSGIIFTLLLTINEDISKIELPAVYAAGNLGRVYKYLYGIIILGAIVTTAISSAYGFLNNICKTKKTYKKINFLICFGAIFVSLFGFSNLVNSLYPVFGILGLIQLLIILKAK